MGPRRQPKLSGTSGLRRCAARELDPLFIVGDQGRWPGHFLVLSVAWPKRSPDRGGVQPGFDLTSHFGDDLAVASDVSELDAEDGDALRTSEIDEQPLVADGVDPR
jgi:hypothetical protein